MNAPDLDFSQEPYIAEMWAYAKNLAHTAQLVGINLQCVEARLQAARACSDDWLATWAQMAATSLEETRDLQATVVRELEQLAFVYQDLALKKGVKNTS